LFRFSGTGEARLDDKSGDTAGRKPATIANEVISHNGVSARTSVDDASRVDDFGQSEQPDKPTSAMASDNSEQLPLRMWFIAGAGLISWILIAIGAMIFFF
jgi:hypothetical protein